MIATTRIFLSPAFEEIKIILRTSFTPCGTTCQSPSDQERDGWSGRLCVGGGELCLESFHQHYSRRL